MIIALVLVIVAAILFAIDFARSEWNDLTALGLALFATGIAVYIYETTDVLR